MTGRGRPRRSTASAACIRTSNAPTLREHRSQRALGHHVHVTLASRAADCHDRPVGEIFLETERLILRRFTPDDVDLLVELDSDPDVMRYINGGRPTPREEIETDILPWRPTRATVSGRSSRNPVASSSAGSTSGRSPRTRPTSRNSATACVDRRATRATAPRARGRSSGRGSGGSARSASMRKGWPSTRPRDG